MIIVTGPTGSGKTTTLYAFLKKIRNPEIKVITIEESYRVPSGWDISNSSKPKKGLRLPAGSNQ